MDEMALGMHARQRNAFIARRKLMAVETHQVLAKSGRGHEARLSDRSGMGSGKAERTNSPIE